MSGDPFRLRVEADHLARVMGNALAFFPAKGQVDTARLQIVVPDRIIATGTDTYTAGQDSCPCDGYTSPNESALMQTVELDRDGWREIEAQTRKDKGETGVLQYEPGDCLIYMPGGRKASKAVAIDMTGKSTARFSTDGITTQGVWELIDDLFHRLGEQETRFTFDPDYLARFSKVKIDKALGLDRVVDLAHQGDDEPMLAKVGPTFMGAIMPVDREVYTERQPEGQESLF